MENERLIYQRLCSKYKIKEGILDTDKLKMLTLQVNEFLENNPEIDKKYVTENLLRRFLLYHVSVKKASLSVQKYLKWRTDENIDHITGNDIDVKKELDVGRQTFIEPTKDRCGRPLVIVHAKAHNKYESDPKSLRKYLIYINELLAKEANNTEIKNYCCVFDLQGLSSQNMDYQLVKSAIPLVQNYYPELLGTALIINYPKLFHGVWKMVRMWMSETFRSRFLFVSESELNDFLEVDELPVQLNCA